MPTYRVTDPTSGKTVKLTGDSPPTEEELEEIFSSIGAGEQPEQAPAQQEEPVPQWGRENPNLYGAYGAGKEIIKQTAAPVAQGLALAGGALIGGPVGAWTDVWHGTARGKTFTRKDFWKTSCSIDAKNGRSL